MIVTTDSDWGGSESELAFARGDVVAGRYKITDLVGSGGTGEVYRATDQALGGTVALKTLKRGVAHPVLLERFRREAQNALRVTHPNVCRIRDIGIHEQGGQKRFFLTMELLEGESLAVALARRPSPYSTAEALPILSQIAEGLQAAHDSSVVHRDLKPGNVVLLPPPPGRDTPRAVITDFGLAISEEQISLGLTESSDVIGTPEYMAPEQSEVGSTTPALDIYALGIIAFEMLTKKRPFAEGATPIMTMLLRRREPPKRLSAALPGADAAWDAAITRCLEREPGQRFARAADFITAIVERRVAPPARVAPPTEEKRRWFGRGERKPGGR
jgi:serine/threonine protein kinase